MWSPGGTLGAGVPVSVPQQSPLGCWTRTFPMEMAGPLASIRCDRDPSLTQGHRVMQTSHA